MPETIRITALLTCHNRRELTLRCLEELFSQELPAGVELDAVLVDDGCTDGTGEAVRASFPQVRVVEGTGSLFWCGGMRLAWTAAAETSPDYYLAVNDDTVLLGHALGSLLKLAPNPGEARIAVAAVADPESGRPTYGGKRRKQPGPVTVGGRPARCDTFNANCVLITREAYRRLGMFHSAYTHGMGDYDYGLQATKKNIPILQSSEVLGFCAHNDTRNTWHDSSLPRLERLRKLQSPTGLPWREYLVFTFRNNGRSWPRHFLTPFFRIIFRK